MCLAPSKLYRAGGGRFEVEEASGSDAGEAAWNLFPSPQRLCLSDLLTSKSHVFVLVIKSSTD